MDKIKKPAHIILVLVLVASIMIGTVATVLAHWEPGAPNTKWVQMPDVDDYPTALCCTYFSGAPPWIGLAADDFLCTETGPITDIHVWGCWEGDDVNEGAVFEISIWSNIAEGPYGYSIPGEPVWPLDSPYTFGPGDYEVRLWQELPQPVLFWFPFPTDPLDFTEIHQYNFYIPREEAFVQQKDEIYWLSVREVSGDGNTAWGWNYAYEETQWNDDAVWMFFEEPFWVELEYFDGPYQGNSVDFAFVITGPPPPQPLPPSPPSGATVDGDVYPVNKVSLLAPWIVLGMAIIAGSIVLIRRRAHR